MMNQVVCQRKSLRQKNGGKGSTRKRKLKVERRVGMVRSVEKDDGRVRVWRSATAGAHRGEERKSGQGQKKLW